MSDAVRKPVVAVTGTIGAGKSTAAQAFARRGGVIVDADRVGHEVLDRPSIRKQLVSQWGQGTIRDREHERLGTSDRALIVLRQIWDRELRALAEGRPLKQWTIPERMELSPTYHG